VEQTGMPLERAQAILKQYHTALPFVKQLQDIYQNQAISTGITTLYGGAKRHWNRYEVRWPGNEKKNNGPCSLEEARQRVADPEHPWYGQVPCRAKTYRALNALIQGSSAVHTKLWMLSCWREGIVPLLQMHDALIFSVSTREEGERIAQLGCEAVKLSVPMRVGLKFGRSWGDATHSWEELAGTHVSPAPARQPAPAPVASTLQKPEPAPAPVLKGAGAPATTKAAAAPATHHNCANVRAVEQAPLRRAQDSIAFPAFAASNAATIDLAELVDEPVPKSRKIRCRFHDERTASLHIYRDHYFCYGCRAYGDHIDWLVQIRGLDLAAAQKVLTNWSGPVITPEAAQAQACRDSEQEERDRAYALRWWDGAKPIKGTLAARYLAETRGIDLDLLPASIDDVLRFHEHGVWPRSAAAVLDCIDARCVIRRAHRHPAHRPDRRCPEDRPLDARRRRRGEAVAGVKAAGRRHGAGDDARGRDQGAVSQRAAAARLGAAFRRHVENIPAHSRCRAVHRARGQRRQQVRREICGGVQAPLARSRPPRRAADAGPDARPSQDGFQLIFFRAAPRSTRHEGILSTRI
jgi:hypothetical protein